jgi:hypothetical protein
MCRMQQCTHVTLYYTRRRRPQYTFRADDNLKKQKIITVPEYFVKQTYPFEFRDNTDR